jgi:hypothetical protein
VRTGRGTSDVAATPTSPTPNAASSSPSTSKAARSSPANPSDSSPGTSASTRPAPPEGSYNVQYAHERVVTPALGYGSLCILNQAGTILHRDQIANSSHDACIVIS